MTGVILVRHALPEIQQGVAARLWGLSESAREDCVLLSHGLGLPLGGVVHSSPERKARETADVLALRLGRFVREYPALAEVDRPPDWEPDYRSLARRYLAGVDHPGWEPKAAAAARFAATVDEIRAGSGATPIIVSHGLITAAYLATVTPSAWDAAAFWDGLTLPDAWRFDPENQALTHAFFGGLPPGE